MRIFAALLLAVPLAAQGCAWFPWVGGRGGLGGSGHDPKFWGNYDPEVRWDKVLKFYADQDVDDVREWRELSANWEKARGGSAEERLKVDRAMKLLVDRIRHKYYLPFINAPLLEEAIIEKTVHKWMTEEQVHFSTGDPLMTRPPYDPQKDPKPDPLYWIYDQVVDMRTGHPEYKVRAYVTFRKITYDGRDFWVVTEHENVDGIRILIPGTTDGLRSPADGTYRRTTDIKKDSLPWTWKPKAPDQPK